MQTIGSLAMERADLELDRCGWPSRRCWSELGRRTALGGDKYFRAKAYQRAANTLAALVEPLDRVIAENRLRELPGIGETIADIVTKLRNTGTHRLLEKLLRRHVPQPALHLRLDIALCRLIPARRAQ